MKQKSCFKKVLTLIAILSMGVANIIPTVEVFANTTDENAVVLQNGEEEVVQEKPLEEPPMTQSDSVLPATNDIEDDVLLDELAKANDSPVINSEEVETIYYNEDGTLMYNGEPVYVGEGNEEISANLNELMKAGVPTKLRAGGATIEYLGQVRYSYSIVGLFKVNGKIAFCLQHPKPTPGTGTPNNGLEPYSNDNIRRILYYGWGGPGNIFTDQNQGIVITSLVLSKYYNGDISDSGAPGWAELDELAKNGKLVQHGIDLNGSNNLVDLKVNVKEGKQISETGYLRADASNYIDVNIPQGMTYVSESTGATATNRSVRIYGGQRYHLEADLKYTNNFQSGVKKGFVQAFQPLVVRPLDGRYQTLGTWRWYDDPAQTVSFSAKFFARMGHAKILKVDEETNKPLSGAKFKIELSNGKVMEETTNAAGEIDLKDIDNAVTGTVTEIQAPTGHVINSTPQKFTIKAGETVGLTFTNREISGSVKLLKYADEDWQTGATNTFLKDAEFSLIRVINGNEVVLDIQRTNEKGEIEFTDVRFGEVIIRETKTPTGYTPVADMTVDITIDGQVIELIATDKVIREDMKLVKVDQDSALSILSQDAEFTITNLQTNQKVTQTNLLGVETSIFTTNEKGEILLPNLPYGRYRIEEVNAPFGYLQLSKPVEFFINGKNNGLLTVEIGNKIVKGQVTLTKTGEKVTSVETQETEYGILYLPTMTQELLNDVTFEIFARKDIVTGDGKTQHKEGDLVGTYTTDETGTFTSEEFFIGSYFAKEKTAPNGFIVKEDEIDFTIDYEGQLVALTSTSIEAENDWNKAKVVVHKLDESLVGYEENTVQIEEILSNDKVFGLFRKDSYTFNEVELIPTGGLVGVSTTSEGKATFEGQFPDGEYYAQELNAGDSHVISDKQYPVVLTPTDNREELEANVYADSTFLNNENYNRMARNPILNKLFLTSIPFEKMNETSKLQEGTGYIYEYNQLGEGAEFELKNEAGAVIQTVIIDKNGLGVWKDLVVGHYSFKETKASNDTLVLDETVYAIDVTQEKTVITNTSDGTILAEVDNSVTTEKEESDQVTDTEDAVVPLETPIDTEVTEQDESEEEIKEVVTTPVFTLKNRAIRGETELEKTDVSTGKKLPNTGIEIKDNNGKTVVKGRTDSNGQFKFQELPKGTYTFVEYDAPAGYLLDTTPVPFEIKEDGEIIKCQMTNVKKVDKLRQTKANNQLVMGLVILSISLFVVAFVGRFKLKNNANH